MDPLWSETCRSTFKHFIILIVSTNYILCISWIIMCLYVIDARCKHEDYEANIKRNPQENERDDMDCDTTQAKGQWGDFVKTVMKQQITWKAINALNSWETILWPSGTPGVRNEHAWAHSVSLLCKRTVYYTKLLDAWTETLPLVGNLFLKCDVQTSVQWIRYEPTAQGHHAIQQKRKCMEYRRWGM